MSLVDGLKSVQLCERAAHFGAREVLRRQRAPLPGLSERHGAGRRLNLLAAQPRRWVDRVTRAGGSHDSMAAVLLVE